MRHRIKRTLSELKRKDQVCRQVKAAGAASMTLECAAVLPLFFLACVTLLLFMDAVRIQGTRNLELSNKARYIASAAGFSGNHEDGKWIDIRSAGVYRFAAALPGIPKLRYALRARVYPWIGSDSGISLPEEGEREDTKTGVVYLTDNESVYHTNPECTHLDLAVFQSTTAEIGSLRNAYGKKYRKCRGFPKGYQGPVYASAKGDYYYPTPDYGSLVRHVRIVSVDDCAGMKECERCAQHEHEALIAETGGAGDAA